MRKPNPLGTMGFLLLVVTMFPGRSVAQIDVSGEWANRVHEDQPHRVPGPNIGDYTGLPLNDDARLRADSWNASIYSAREHQTQPASVIYGFHGIANMRISKVVDDATQQVVAYKIFRSPGTGNTRMIWYPEYASKLRELLPKMPKTSTQ